jgi:hypothetical protein
VPIMLTFRTFEPWYFSSTLGCFLVGAFHTHTERSA